MNYKEQIEQKAREYAANLVTDPNLEEYDYTLEDFKAGAEAMREIANTWIDVNDRSIPMPENTDILIKFEGGEIRRYYEDWEDEMRGFIITHWKSIIL